MPDPAAPAPADIQTTPALLRRAAASWSAAEAVADVQFGTARRLSFGELLAEVRSFAGALVATGFAPGDRLAIWAPNTWHWVVAALGTHWAGGTLVPVNTRYTGSEALDLLERTGAHTLVVSGRFLGDDKLIGLCEAGGTSTPADRTPLADIVRIPYEAGDDLTAADAVAPVRAWDDLLALADDHNRAEADVRAAAVAPDDVADILFTSGTTGRSKGVLALQRQTVGGGTLWGENGALSPADRYLVVNPFFHSFGYKAGIIAALRHGTAIVPLAVYSPVEAMRLIDAERITVLPGAPTIFQMLLDAPTRPDHSLATLRLAVTGAATVPVRLIERMQSELSFDTVLTAYGLSETSGFVSSCVPGDDAVTVATTCGRPYPGTEVRIGDKGEVLVRSALVMAGYLADDAATVEAIDADGWLHTGDVGELDERGYLTITDRLKDMFICGGFNVYPAEIEQVLSRLDGVAESAVIGVPDERLGEVGAAYVRLSPGVSLDAAGVVAHCKASLANFKVPRAVEFVEEFPRNASGKILKTELRARR